MRLLIGLLGCAAASSMALAAERPTPFVNQAGYNLGEAKRFTLPGAPDRIGFEVIRDDSRAVVYRGVVSGQMGDFSSFNPVAPRVQYRVRVPGYGQSVPFEIADHLLERNASRLAYQFFIDVRGGMLPTVSPRAVTGGGPSRDGGGQTLETTFDGLLYASNPALFDRWTNELSYFHTDAYEALVSVVMPESEPPELASEHTSPTPRSTAPDLIKLLLWHAEWAYNNMDYDGPTSLGFENWKDYSGVREFGYDDQHLQQFDRQNLVDQLAAAHAFYRPFLQAYMTPEQHAAMRKAALDRWTAYDREKEVRYWVKSHKWIDEGRLEFNEMGNAFGQGLLRNLLMYIGEKQEPGGDPERFAAYTRACAEDIIAHWDFSNPVHTWRARNAEHITPQALAMLLLMAPEIAPAGTREKLEAWRNYVVSRTDNLWNYRTHSDTEWAHPRSKEIGTVAGMGGSMFAVAAVLNDPKLRALGWSQVDFVFGRNPAGAALSRKSAVRVALKGYWPGVENGWPVQFLHGTGALGYVRGALDGSPTNDAFPYNPSQAAAPDRPGVYGTEGWAISNRAWLTTVAFSTLGSQSVRFVDKAGVPVAKVRAGEVVVVELRAALNEDPNVVEKGYVLVVKNGDAGQKVAVTETGPNTGVFTAKVKAPSSGSLTASYGFLAFRKAATVTVQ